MDFDPDFSYATNSVKNENAVELHNYCYFVFKKTALGVCSVKLTYIMMPANMSD